MNVLRSLPINVPAPLASKQGRRGSEVDINTVSLLQLLIIQKNLAVMIQRLIQKEKQVIQLQNDLDRFKIRSPGEGLEEQVIQEFDLCPATDECRMIDLSANERR